MPPQQPEGRQGPIVRNLVPLNSEYPALLSPRTPTPDSPPVPRKYLTQMQAKEPILEAGDRHPGHILQRYDNLGLGLLGIRENQVPLGQEENPCRGLEGRMENEDRRGPPPPSTRQSLRRLRLWAAALHLAVTTVDLLHGVGHQDRPFLPALQFLQLGVPLQPDVITTERDRYAEDTGRRGASCEQALLRAPLLYHLLF